MTGNRSGNSDTNFQKRDRPYRKQKKTYSDYAKSYRKEC